MNRVPIPIMLTCPQWKAPPPIKQPVLAGRPNKGLLHHTAGHHAEIQNPRDESVEEAIRYAQDIRHLHVVKRGWNDSGHSFLICRNGIILQGRWGTVTAIEAGRMVVSAHCPGQNDQPGVEHEHNGTELMTRQQFAASVALYAWIFDRCSIRPTEIYGHNHFYNTACPAALSAQLLTLRLEVAKKLTAYGRSPSRYGTSFGVNRAIKKELRTGAGHLTA